MIHYHGTPLGGTRASVTEFLRGRHALVPFPRPEDLPTVADVCHSFILDNGAFSIWKSGGTLDVEGYIRWCEEWRCHPGFDWALIPDVIDGNEAENDAMLAGWPRNIPGVPVWHFHESLDRLEVLVRDWPRIALGSSGAWPTPGANGWWGRMANVMDAVCDATGRPQCKLHGLRMLAPSIFEHLPLSSADSTNVAQNSQLVGRFGQYAPPTQTQRRAVIAARIESHNSAAVWKRPAREQMEFSLRSELDG
jgi:hypothetical protein